MTWAMSWEAGFALTFLSDTYLKHSVQDLIGCWEL